MPHLYRGVPLKSQRLKPFSIWWMEVTLVAT